MEARESYTIEITLESYKKMKPESPSDHIGTHIEATYTTLTNQDQSSNLLNLT